MEDMFKELRSVMDRYQQICEKANHCDEWNEEEEEFIKNSALYFAKAIFNEVPESDKVAKLILLMYEK